MMDFSGVLVQNERQESGEDGRAVTHSGMVTGSILVNRGFQVFRQTGMAAAIYAIATLGFALSLPPRMHAQEPRPDKDYLTETEADRIRDADTPSDRIHLFLNYANDRLSKFESELKRTTTENRREEVLDGLLNGYVGCLDDAADTLALQMEKQADMRAAVKEMDAKSKDFLDRLQAIEKAGKEIDLYKDTLDDAIDGTEEARRDVTDDQKAPAGPPIRRKP
jgi:hypothetical protein